jgi:predicted nucleotidyltransferase
MRSTLLDLSLRTELERFVPLVAELESAALRAGARTVLTGAFARDLHLEFLHGIPAGRRTEDVDFGVAVSGWSRFDALKSDLTTSGTFESTGIAHRIIHRPSGVVVDLVPFAGVENESRQVAWPPRGEIKMDAFGLTEAMRSAIDVRFPKDVVTRVVSLPALAMLKLIAWNDRHLSAPRKDAHDLMVIASNYLECGGHDRLLEEFSDWTQDPDFDYELAGTRMLGCDIRNLFDDAGRARVARILSEQSDEERPGALPGEMSRQDPDHARRMLAAILRGLSEK